MSAEIDEIRKRVSAFNHQYAQHGGFKSDELKDLGLVLDELDRLAARVAELERALRDIPCSCIDKQFVTFDVAGNKFIDVGTEQCARCAALGERT